MSSETAPPTLSLRERNKREKLARIRAAARELFGTLGFEKATTRAISKRAGIGVGTLFSYFPDKHALLVHLFVTEIGEVAAAAFDAAASDPRPPLDRVAAVFGALFDYYARDEALSRVVVKEMVFLPPNPKKALEASSLGFILSLARLIDAARARGELAHDAPSVLVATSAFAHYYFVLLSWLGGTLSPASRDAVLRELLATRLEGQTPEQPRP